MYNGCLVKNSFPRIMIQTKGLGSSPRDAWIIKQRFKKQLDMEDVTAVWEKGGYVT
jgi:hypothetical protein